jgi:hypothetical protein
MCMRFVILKHRGHDDLHYDLMLEGHETLITWSCSQNPLTHPTAQCKRIADHRKAYLTYEGPVSQNRGVVEQIASGQYEALEIDESHWVVQLEGKYASVKLTLPAIF